MKKKYNSPDVQIMELGAVSLAVTSNLDGGDNGTPGDRAEAREFFRFDSEDVVDTDNTLDPGF